MGKKSIQKYAPLAMAKMVKETVQQQFLNQNQPTSLDPVHSKYYSDQGRMYIIKKGVQDTPMVGWGAALNEEKIHAVYAYVRSLRTSEGSDVHDHSSHEH